MAAGLARVEALLDGESAPPIARLLGMQVVAVEPGRVVVEIDAGRRATAGANGIAAV